VKLGNLIFVVGLIVLTLITAGFWSQQQTGFSISESKEMPVYQSGNGIPEAPKSGSILFADKESIPEDGKTGKEENTTLLGNETEIGFGTESIQTNGSHICTSDATNDYIRGTVKDSAGNKYNTSVYGGYVNITVKIISGNETGAIIENVSVDDANVPALLYGNGYYSVPDDINCLEAGDNFTIKASNGTHFGNATDQLTVGGGGLGSWGGNKLNITLQWEEEDATPPVVTIISPLNNSVVVKNWTWANVSLDENGSNCVVQYDKNGTNLTMSNSTVNKTTWYLNVSSMPDGKHNLTFWCNDTSNNWGTNITTFNVTTGVPAITFVTPTPTNATRQTNNWIYVNVTVSASANIANCTLSWNGTNASMAVVGSGTDVSCYLNMTTTDSQTYTFLVYANDTNSVTGVSQTRQNTENSLPSITSANITPLSPDTNANLNCSTIGWSDSESDPERYNISFNNGTTNLNFFNVTQPFYLLNGNTTKGQTWNCTAVPFDQYEYGTAKNSNNITIQNSAPTAPTLNTITPNPAYKASMLYSTINSASTDADGDSISYYYQWSNDSGFSYIISQGFNATPTNFTLNCNSYSECKSGATMYLYVKAVTSDANSSYSSYVSRDITNSVPTLTSVTANVSYAKQGTPVRINTTTAADGDNDNLRIECGTSSGISDICNGTYGSPERECSFTTTWSDNSAHTVYCRVNDSTAVSTPDRTTIITADNSGPTVTYVSPTPASSSRQTNNQVTINVTVTDTNGVDACILEWNGANESMTRVGSGTSVSCNITKVTTDGSSYSFRVYANDSLGNIGAESQRTFNENDKSVSTVPTITPALPYTNDSLNCNATLTDGLDTPLTAYWTWYKNGAANQSGITTSLSNNSNNIITTLPAGDTTAFENWSCSVIPFDGYENGSRQNSTNVTIQDFTATFSSLGTSDTNHNVNALFYSYVSDIDGLSGCYISTNNSGTFANSTFISIAGTAGWCNVSLVLNSTNNLLISWTVYANDSIGTWYISSPQSLTTSNTLPILTVNPAINDTSPQPGSIINCNAGTYYDANGDTQSAIYWQWWNITGTPAIVGSSQTLNLWSIGAVTGEKYRCSQSVFDGYSNSSWYNSSNNATIASDSIKPFIRNETATPWVLNQTQTTNLTANVTDNAAVSKAWVQISWPNTTYIGNFSMTKDGGDIWYYEYVTTTSNPGGNYSFFVYANDTTSNLNSSIAPKEFKLNDVTSPILSSPSASPSIANQSQTINITTTVTDETNVNQVIVQITYPNNTNQNFTMIPDGGNTWYYEFSNTQETGTYNYTIFASDTSNNWGNTTIQTFDIQDSTAPKYYNIKEPTDPSIYDPATSYQFNATWNDTDSSISNVIFEFNGTNYTYLASQVQNVSSEFYYSFTSLGVGTYNYRWYANDTKNNWNATTTFTFTVSQASTSIKLFLNGTEGNKNYGLGDFANFTVALNISGKTVYLNTSIPGWVLQSGATPLVNITQLNSLGYFTITGSFLGDQNYTGSSQTYFANVTDTTAPQWSNNQSSYPATYAVQASVFNITWTDNVNVSIVQIEGNWSGSATNYTATLISGTTANGVWSYNATLPAGTFYWKSYATDTSGNKNLTDIWEFTIGKANNPINLYLNGTAGNQTYTYPATVNATGTATAGIVYLWRDGAFLKSGASPQTDSALLGNGTYAYTVNATGNTNYSDNSTGITYYAFVNKATSSCSLSFNPASGITYGTAVNVSCSCTNTEATAKLYRNGTEVTGEINQNVTLGAETYDYVCNVSSTQNYTDDSDSSDYTVNKADPSSNLNLYLQSVANDQTITYETQSNATGISTVIQDMTFILYRDGSNVGSGNPATELSTLGVGYYAYVYNTTGGTNYTLGSTTTRYLNVTQATDSVTLKLNGVQNSITITYGDAVNASSASTSGTDGIYRNDSNVTSEKNTNVTLAAGYYAYKANTTGNTNYSANPTGVIYYVNILKATPVCNLTFDKTTPQAYGTAITPTCYCTIGGTLYRNGTNVTATENGTAVTLPGGTWNYTCNTTGNLNYTTATNSSLFQITKATTSVTLTLNGSQNDVTYNLNDMANFTVALNVSGKTVYLTTNLSGWVLQSGATPLVNVTQLNNAGYFNITGYFLGDENYTASSDTHFANVTDIEKPKWSSPNVNNTQHNQLAKFSVYWTDNDVLNQYIFSTNNTGVWANDSAVLFSGAGNWSNVTKTINNTNGISIGWIVYARDNYGNWNYTGTQVFQTTNTQPSITNVNVTPDTAYTNNNLNCDVTGYSDANGDSAQYYYTWWNGTTPVLTVLTSATTNVLLNGNTTKGDSWICQIAPFDGYENGTDINDSVTIQNSLPSITSVDVTPDTPNTTSLLTCTPSGWNDNDSDLASYYYAWFDDGSVVSGQTSSTFDCGSVPNCDRGNNMTCQVTPYDGIINGTLLNGSEIIENIPPILTAPPTVNDTNPSHVSTLKCNNGTYYDEDSDSETDYWRWYKNNSIISGQNNQTIYLLGLVVNGDNITCSQLVSDGTSNSTWYNSSNYAIVNATVPESVYNLTVYLRLISNSSGGTASDGVVTLNWSSSPSPDISNVLIYYTNDYSNWFNFATPSIVLPNTSIQYNDTGAPTVKERCYIVRVNNSQGLVDNNTDVWCKLNISLTTVSVNNLNMKANPVIVINDSPYYTVRQNTSNYYIYQFSNRNDSTGSFGTLDYLGEFGLDSWFGSPSSFDKVENDRAYWVKSNQNTTWVVVGRAPTAQRNVTLYGWGAKLNFFGFTSMNETRFEKAINQSTGDYNITQTTKRNDTTGRWTISDYLGPWGFDVWWSSDSNFVGFEPGIGYWLKAAQNTTWSYRP
jgi:hypothetical protein